MTEQRPVSEERPASRPLRSMVYSGRGISVVLMASPCSVLRDHCLWGLGPFGVLAVEPASPVCKVGKLSSHCAITPAYS